MCDKGALFALRSSPFAGKTHPWRMRKVQNCIRCQFSCFRAQFSAKFTCGMHIGQERLCRPHVAGSAFESEPEGISICPW